MIDLVTQDPSRNEYKLIMVEERPWSDSPEKLVQLREKIDNYANVRHECGSAARVPGDRQASTVHSTGLSDPTQCGAQNSSMQPRSVTSITAISSNLHPAGFDELMPKALATATVDRLPHHAHVCNTSGDSVRLTQALVGKGVTRLN